MPLFSLYQGRRCQHQHFHVLFQEVHSPSGSTRLRVNPSVGFTPAEAFLVKTNVEFETDTADYRGNCGTPYEVTDTSVGAPWTVLQLERTANWG